jgi:hypothetical protein
MSKFIVLFLFLVLAGCAASRPALPPPTASKPPTIATGSLGANISSIEKSLKAAATRIERIEILVDSLSTAP